VAESPRYPIFIPSKERAFRCLAARMLRRDGVDFKLVVEPQEQGLYVQKFGKDAVLVLPENNRGLVYARNWIWERAREMGCERHWQIDDNIREMIRTFKGRRVNCNAGVGLRVCEDFTDRYENVAIAGFNYKMFVAKPWEQPPFVVNRHVYSAMLLLTEMPFRFRPPSNSDVDICLQVLAAGWCTLQLNAIAIDKLTTMEMRGGSTSALFDLYNKDGRIRKSRDLERVWPGVVRTIRRFHRPHHAIRDNWTRFDTPLRLKPGIDLTKIPPNEYGFRLVKVGKMPVRSTSLKTWADKAIAATSEARRGET
jgi:hypothetical protein